MRRRRIDCAIATATPLSDGDSLRCDVLCVCVLYETDGDGGRVGSVLLLLPCHTVTRGIRTARVRDWRFSAVPKPGKISILERVCVCVSDSIIEREEKRLSSRFSVRGVKLGKNSSDGSVEFFLRQTCAETCRQLIGLSTWQPCWAELVLTIRP